MKFTFLRTSKTISISGKTVSWERYVKLLNLYCPRKEEEDKPVENTIKECNEDSMKKTPIPEVLSKIRLMCQAMNYSLQSRRFRWILS